MERSPLVRAGSPAAGVDPSGQHYALKEQHRKPQPLPWAFPVRGAFTWYFGSCSLACGRDPPKELWEEMPLLLLTLLLALPFPWQHLADICIRTSSGFWVRRHQQGQGSLDTPSSVIMFFRGKRPVRTLAYPCCITNQKHLPQAF